MRRKYYLSLTEFKQARYSGKTGYLRAYETQILFESYRIQKSLTEFKKVLQNSKKCYRIQKVVPQIRYLKDLISKNYKLFAEISTTYAHRRNCTIRGMGGGWGRCTSVLAYMYASFDLSDNLWLSCDNTL